MLTAGKMLTPLKVVAAVVQRQPWALHGRTGSTMSNVLLQK
jgi:hypothetical protein